MNSITQIRASILLLMVSAIAFSSIASQALAHFITKALSDSGNVRVAPATSCAATKDGAHFTGCSSIL